MKVIIISRNDWANMSYEYVKCMRSVGLDAHGFKMLKHHYNYDNEVPIFNKLEEIKNHLEEADVILFNHTEYIDPQVKLSNKLIGVIHTGSRYRQNHQKMNQLFNQIVDISFCGGDVLNMGAKNEVWIQPVIDLEKINPVYRTDFQRDTLIAHYPSSLKGYEHIQNAIDNVKNKKFKFIYDKKNLPWLENIKRMSKSDIYIEALLSNQNGIPLYIYGITAIEAAALGKIVCTRFPLIKEYEKIFGKCSIIHVEDQKDLTRELERLLSLSSSEFLKLQKESREWAEKYNSYSYIGSMFKRIFEFELKKKRAR